MQRITTRQIGERVSLTCLSTTRFKTSVLSAAVILPLTEENALAALLPQVLARGTARCPDMASLSVELENLYGARAFPFIRKVGENLAVGFISDVIDQAYAAQEDDLLGRAIGLLGDLWQRPYLNNGAFDEGYTAGERENLADKIAALKNDTRSYAVRRLHEVMCETEPFRYCEFGTEEGARAVTAEALTDFWKGAVRSAPLQLFYCGGAPVERVAAAFATSFDVGHAGGTAPNEALVVQAPAKPREVIEEANVTQGKLSLGFRTGITGKSAEYPALMLFAAVFGGYTGSRLFRHVREKRSLCYYASASVEKFKGIMTVASGIENSNFEIARDEILHQLADLRRSGPSDEELAGARRTLVNSLRAMQDSPAAMERFFQSQSVGGFAYDLDQLIDRIVHTTRDEIIAAGQGIGLDTVYFLKGVGQ